MPHESKALAEPQRLGGRAAEVQGAKQECAFWVGATL